MASLTVGCTSCGVWSLRYILVHQVVATVRTLGTFVALCFLCAPRIAVFHYASHPCTPLYISLPPTNSPLPRHWQNSASALPLHGFVCGISSNMRNACYAKRPLYNKYHVLMPQVLLVCFAGRNCQRKACSVSSPPTGTRVTPRCSPSCTNRVYQCRNLALCCWGLVVCGCPALVACAFALPLQHMPSTWTGRILLATVRCARTMSRHAAMVTIAGTHRCAPFLQSIKHVHMHHPLHLHTPCRSVTPALHALWHAH